MNSKNVAKRRDRMRGFSAVELVVVVAIILIVSAVALPSFMQAYRAYQLNDVAGRVAGTLKLARYEAIRRNTTVSAQLQQTSSSPLVEVLQVQGTQTQVLLSGNANLMSAGSVTSTGNLASTFGVATLSSPSLSSGSIQFDQRGAVSPAALNALYIGNSAFPNLGYRAVVSLPSGSVQTWSDDGSGNWKQLN